MEERESARTPDTGQDAAAAAPLSARAVATLLGVNERTIRRAVARGELPATKRAGVYRIAPEAVERYRHGLAATARSGRSVLAVVPLVRPPPLPAALTPLVGREREVAVVAALLRREDARLVTLTGPGGVGKTRLALAAAASAGDAFADGVAFVPLAALTDPALVPPAIAHAVGAREAGDRPLADGLAATLRPRELLLVLDNFEQVADAAAVVADLLAAAPSLKALITSREPVRVSGERVVAVPPLAVPDPVGPSLAADLTACAAVRLFVDRAEAASQRFVLTAENAPAVAAICRRLDGLPLALELAAPRLAHLPPATLLAHLERRLPVLTGGARDLPARQQTMRAAIAWSYDLLDPGDQRLFRRVAVFAGGFTLEAAESVAAVGPSVLDGIASLADKSLLRVEAAAVGERGYGMLETIREFGLERLAESGEEDAVRRRHADWCLAFAEHAGPKAKGPDGAVWGAVVEQEHANLRAALAWLADRGDGRGLIKLAGSLWVFWREHAHFAEGRRWLELALGLGREAPAADRLRALTGAGSMAWYLSDVEQAHRWIAQTLPLARAVGTPTDEAFALINLGALASDLGDYDRALASSEAGLALARAVGAPEPTVLALHNLGELALERGDGAAAARRFAEALPLAREHGIPWLVPNILRGAGVSAAELGEFSRAAALFREGLEVGSARGNAGDVIDALEGVARVDAAVGHQERAARLFGAAAALREEIAMPPLPTELAFLEPVLNAVRDALGADQFAAAWAAGRALSREEATAEALAPFPAPAAPAMPAPGGRPAAPHELTEREREVLRLLAAGATNRAIAERLFISPTTVASHVAHLYGKLGVHSRAEATAFAHRHGLD